MTDTYTPAPFTIAPLAPASVAPALASSDSGSLAPIKPVGSDWSTKRRDIEAKERGKIRDAVTRARHSAEAGWSRPGVMTKAERLAAAVSKGTRDTGSEEERRKTRGSVAKAADHVSAQHPDVKLNTPETRAVLEVLRQRFPGSSLSEIIAEGEVWEREFRDDPIAARNKLIAKYAKMPAENLMPFRVPQRSDGLRGSIQRAQQDVADAEELRAAVAKYGANLPKILAQLEAFDRAMFEDSWATSARIANSYGAPSVEEEIPAFEARQAQKNAAKAHQQRHDAIHRGVNEAIRTGHIPGDEASLTEIAAILQDPDFHRHLQDYPVKNEFEKLKRAASFAQNPNRTWLTGKRANKSAASDAGSKSISGAPGRAATGRQRYGTPSAVRASIDRAMGS